MTIQFQLFVLSTFLVSSLAAKEIRLTPDTDLRVTLREVAAGDSILLANGTWTDAKLKFERLPGTADNPIGIRAESPGQVVLTGAVEFRLSGGT